MYYIDDMTIILPTRYEIRLPIINIHIYRVFKYIKIKKNKIKSNKLHCIEHLDKNICIILYENL
jgi:hypothetical protein